MENKNQPAFALITAGGTIQEGLTKRELIAAMAMQGILSSSPDWDNRETHHPYVATMAVNYADALLKQLSETEKQ